MNDLDINRYVEIFREDAAEQLKNLRNYISKFRSEPDNRENLENIYRVFHSLKGMASVIRFDDLFILSKTLADAFHFLKKAVCERNRGQVQKALEQMADGLGISNEREKNGIYLAIADYLDRQVEDLRKMVEAYRST